MQLLDLDHRCHCLRSGLTAWLDAWLDLSELVCPGFLRLEFPRSPGCHQTRLQSPSLRSRPRLPRWPRLEAVVPCLASPACQGWKPQFGFRINNTTVFSCTTPLLKPLGAGTLLEQGSSKSHNTLHLFDLFRSAIRKGRFAPSATLLPRHLMLRGVPVRCDAQRSILSEILAASFDRSSLIIKTLKWFKQDLSRKLRPAKDAVADCPPHAHRITAWQ